MELRMIRGGTYQDLHSRNYNIGIGISLGNKWFTPENIKGLVEWSLDHTKGYVLVYVADGLHAINVEVRNRKSPERAREIALSLGKSILDATEKLIAEQPSLAGQHSRIFYANWDDVLTPEYKEKLSYLETKYKYDQAFRNTILGFIEDMTKHEQKRFSDVEKEKLGTYLLEEMPEVLARVPVKGLSYDANAYPYDSEFLKLVEEIQRGNIFPEIRENIIDTEPKVFLEVR